MTPTHGLELVCGWLIISTNFNMRQGVMCSCTIVSSPPISTLPVWIKMHFAYSFLHYEKLTEQVIQESTEWRQFMKIWSLVTHTGKWNLHKYFILLSKYAKKGKADRLGWWWRTLNEWISNYFYLYIYISPLPLTRFKLYIINSNHHFQ